MGKKHHTFQTFSKNYERRFKDSDVFENIRTNEKKGYVKQNKVNYRKYNSYKSDLGGVKENILNQNFKATKPYEKAGTDITMFRVKEEAVYLSPTIDFYTREILSYEIGTDAKLEKVLNMIKKLKENHQDNIKGMIIQSDQGVQY